MRGWAVPWRTPEAVPGGSPRPQPSPSPRGPPAYAHGDVPGHVHVGLEAVHPHLGRPQGIALRVVVDVVVVGLLGTLDVGHAGAGQNLHAAAALPHLWGPGPGWQPPGPRAPPCLPASPSRRPRDRPSRGQGGLAAWAVPAEDAKEKPRPWVKPTKAWGQGCLPFWIAHRISFLLHVPRSKQWRDFS